MTSRSTSRRRMPSGGPTAPASLSRSSASSTSWSRRRSRLPRVAGHRRSDHDQRRTAMLKNVFYTSVLVSDQDRALDFYTNALGLEKRVENPTPDGPRFLTVGVNGDDFQLVLW